MWARSLKIRHFWKILSIITLSIFIFEAKWTRVYQHHLTAILGKMHSKILNKFFLKLAISLSKVLWLVWDIRMRSWSPVFAFSGVQWASSLSYKMITWATQRSSGQRTSREWRYSPDGLVNLVSRPRSNRACLECSGEGNLNSKIPFEDHRGTENCVAE